ncbi:MAG: hypothetical protein ACREPB_00900 [Arenimonas sp.]
MYLIMMFFPLRLWLELSVFVWCVRDFKADEAFNIAKMTDILRREIGRDYAKGGIRRHASRKTGALLRVDFWVEFDLSKELKVNIFAEHAFQHKWKNPARCCQRCARRYHQIVGFQKKAQTWLHYSVGGMPVKIASCASKARW